MNNFNQDDNAQNKMEDVLSSMPVGLAWANIENGEIQFVNKKFTAMFGYELKDLTTVHHWIENCYADTKQAKKIDGFWLSLENSSDRKPTELEDFELDILCKDGSIKTVLSGKIMLPHHGGAVSTFLDITPRKKEEQIIKKQALEDPLTGLLNKRAFSQVLKSYIQKSQKTSDLLSLLMLDLDGFKQINDTLGHDRGDMLLKHVAERLRISVRDIDSVCRIGGDEFCIIIDTPELESSSEIIAGRIIDCISKPFKLDTEIITVGVSIGISDYPKNATDEDTLFKFADEALYRAKNSGRGKWSR